MPTIDLSLANSYGELSKTLYQIQRGGNIPTVKGSLVSYGINSLNFSDLKTKIQQIYTELKSSNKMELEQYRQLNSLIFEIQTLSNGDSKTKQLYNRLFLQDSQMHNIEVECLQKIHDDPELMDYILKQYDQLAATLNQHIRMGASESDTKEMLPTLKYLNSIIGLEWNEKQIEGKEPVPLWTEERSAGNLIPKSMKIHDCQKLTALNALLTHVNENEYAGRFRDKLVISGMGEYLFADFEKKIKELTTKEWTRFPFAKSEIAYEALLAINQLKQINPRPSSETKDLDELEAKCLNTIRQDPKRMKFARKQFNKLARDANRQIIYKLVTEYKHTYMPTPQSMQELKLLGKILDKPISLEQFNCQALIQPVVKPGQTQRATNIIRFNAYRSLINHEIELREKIKELKALNWQIDPQNLSSTLLEPETIKEISEKINRLSDWICDKFIDVNDPNSHYSLKENLESYQMPDSLFKSILASCGEFAKIIEKPLTENELKGVEFIPRLEFQIEIERENFFQHLNDINKVNYMINAANHHLKLRNLHAKREELIHAITLNAPFFMNLAEMDAVNQEIFKISKEPHILETFSTHRNFVQWIEEFIPFYEAVTHNMLSKEQKEGLEEIPMIDLDKISLPDREKLIRDYESLSKVDRTWIDMPDSIRAALKETPVEAPTDQNKSSLTESDSIMSVEEVSPPVSPFPELQVAIPEKKGSPNDELLPQYIDKLKTDLLYLRFLKLEPHMSLNFPGKEGLKTDYKTLSASILSGLKDMFTNYNIQENNEKIKFIETKLNLSTDEREQLFFILYSEMSEEELEAIMAELDLTEGPWTPPDLSQPSDMERELLTRFAFLSLPPIPSTPPVAGKTPNIPEK